MLFAVQTSSSLHSVLCLTAVPNFIEMCCNIRIARSLDAVHVDLYRSCTRTPRHIANKQTNKQTNSQLLHHDCHQELYAVISSPSNCMPHSHLKKLVVAQLVACYGRQRFSTARVFTRAPDRSLSYEHLIFSSHLCLNFPSGLFP